LWWEQLGASDARALMAYDNEPGEVALRVNTLLTDVGRLASELSVATHPDPDLPEALVLEGPFDAHESPAWRAGAFLPQSRAAMHVARALDPQPGERVLDLCAAPGGKSTHLAALMQGQGEVVAVERNARRAGLLARTAQRLHAANVRVEVSDATLPRREGAVFDRVLVDPPCSGLGTLQARADLRWRVTPQDVGEMTRTQASILSAGASALRPGGVLVYSTCTISPTENERQIAAFLDTHLDFSCDDLAAELPSLQMRLPDSSTERGSTADQRSASSSVSTASTAGLVLTLPHRDHTAGFFIARLRRS
jgi:16S rRNA (cytosine967-C5)-methyltransferase